MSVSIRLSKTGKKHAPAYKIVVAKTRSKRKGKYVDILGFYNPLETENKFSIDKDKYNEWVKNGAIVTEAVQSVIEGKHVHSEYNPHKKNKQATKNTVEEEKDTSESNNVEKETEEKEEASDEA